MPARKKVSGKRGKPIKLTQEALLEDTRRGSNRADIFLKPEPNQPYKWRLRFLPGLAQRGPNGVEVPYFVGMQHWHPVVTERGTTYKAGVACIDFMKRQHPHQWERWRAAGVQAVIEDRPCLDCEILRNEELEDDNGEPVWPRLQEFMQFGKPSMYWSTSYSFAVVHREDEEGSHPVKIFPTNKTIKEQVMDLADPDGPFPYLLDPYEGYDVQVRRYGGQPWKFSVTPLDQCDIGIENWEAACPDLDMTCPNWWTREELEAWWEKNLPKVLTTKPMKQVMVSTPEKPKTRAPSRRKVAKSVTPKKPRRKSPSSSRR